MFLYINYVYVVLSLVIFFYFQLCFFGWFICQLGGIICIQELFKCDCLFDCDDGSDEIDMYVGCINVVECLLKSGVGIGYIIF